MKTNQIKRSAAKARIFVVCFLLAVVAAIEIGMGGSFVSRFGQTPANTSDTTQAPNVDLSVLVIAAR